MCPRTDVLVEDQELTLNNLKEKFDFFLSGLKGQNQNQYMKVTKKKNQIQAQKDKPSKS